MPRRVGAKPRYIFKPSRCMLSRPLVCWAIGMVKIL
jgi:hypothetical protein